MFVLVIGAAASGKSAWGERCACALPGPRTYVATMGAQGAEAGARIARHRAARAGRGFATCERPVDLAGLSVPADAVVLLDCLGNLVANELFDPAGGGPGSALAGVRALAGRCAHLVVVTNEVFLDGIAYGEGTQAYLRELAAANRALASACDCAVEVACGVPCVLKGTLPAGVQNGGAR